MVAVECITFASLLEGFLSAIMVMVGNVISADGSPPVYSNQHRSGEGSISCFSKEAMDGLVDILQKRLLRLLVRLGVMEVLASVAVVSTCQDSRLFSEQLWLSVRPAREYSTPCPSLWRQPVVLQSRELWEISYVAVAREMRGCIKSIQEDPPPSLAIESSARSVLLSLAGIPPVLTEMKAISWRAVEYVPCDVEKHHLRELKSLPRPHPVIHLIVSIVPMLLWGVDTFLPWQTLRQEVLGLADELILEMAMFCPRNNEKSDGAIRAVINDLKGRGLESPSDVGPIHTAAAVLFEWVLLAYEKKKTTTRSSREMVGDAAGAG